MLSKIEVLSVYATIGVFTATVGYLAVFQTGNTTTQAQQITTVSTQKPVFSPTPTASPKAVRSAKSTPVPSPAVVVTIQCVSNWQKKTFTVTKAQCDAIIAQDTKDADTWLKTANEASRRAYEKNMQEIKDSTYTGGYLSSDTSYSPAPLATYNPNTGLATQPPIVLNTPKPDCVLANGVTLCTP